MRLARVPREEMAQNHAAAAAKEPKNEAAASRERNVETVLEIGSAEYFLFRGRSYRAPPVPWKAGKRLHAIYVQLTRYTLLRDEQTAREYFSLIEQLPSMLWRMCRPTGPGRRLLRALGLHRNPFQQATERELVELASFFLTRRQKSNIRLLPATPALEQTGT